MASVSWDRDRERIEQELEGTEYQLLLQRLQKDTPLLGTFRSWADALAFMRVGTSSDPLKDDILRPIFQAHAEDGNHRWRTILLTVFWPGLRSIHFRKRHWDPDADERWQNIAWAFLQVICRVDVGRRPDRLVQKVFNDTVHHLYDEYRRTWYHVSRERAVDSKAIAELAGGTEGIDLTGIELRDAQEFETRRLREHVAMGRISEADFLLLVGTRVYGQSVAEYASEAGLDYQVAKKRRQRAKAAIERFERRNGNSAISLSPRESLVPPLAHAGKSDDGGRRRGSDDRQS